MSEKTFKRNVRIAVSSVCNLNCIYCEGNKGYRKDKMGAMEDFRKTQIYRGVAQLGEEVRRVLRTIQAKL